MKTSAGNILLLLGLLLLAACSSGEPTAAVPTQDVNSLRTEVAATVLAQVPQICALTPTATLLPTNTTVATIEPTATSAATATQSSNTPAAVTTGTLDDQAKWVSQSVQDGTRFTPGQAFTMTWELQNVGKTTWTTNYRLRFYAGNAFGAPKEIPLTKQVQPGETVEITIDMKAPTKSGDYVSNWVMSNPVLRNFNQPVFLKITVGTPSPTPTVPAKTATPTPTATTKP